MRLDKLTRALLLPLLPTLAAGLLAGCSDFNPTSVKNPNLTTGQFLGTPGSGASWLLGVQRQFLSTLNILVQDSELMSDDYYNDYTTNDQLFDKPEIDNFDTDVNSMQSNVALLRQMATFGLDTVFPRDSSEVTANQKAELLFFRGMANLFAGESFVGLPAQPLGPVVSADSLLALAIADFTLARTTTDSVPAANSYTAALARAHYRKGEQTLAVQEATTLLTANPTFIRYAVFDPTNGPSNSLQGLLTSSVNNFQPLPRLDFLDPKYPNLGGSPVAQSPIAFLKAEEAHLIIAEGLLQSNNVPGAQARLNQLLTLVQSRATTLVDGTLQKRGRAGGKIIYPNTSNTQVAFAPGQPLRSGFVLTRQGPKVSVPTISGTSVTTAQINAVTTPDQGLYVVYLMRQEIFMAEGRRAADLGIRIPVSLTELLSNPLTSSSATYATAQIPSYIPSNFAMDGFVFDSVAHTATMLYDMNTVIVQNQLSPFGKFSRVHYSSSRPWNKPRR